jgi:hypothetical protein
MAPDIVVIGAVVRLKSPVATFSGRKQDLSVASVTLTVGATFKVIFASLLSHNTDVGS